jgi:hypothetical protein
MDVRTQSQASGLVFGAEHSFVEHDELAVAGEADRHHAHGMDL